MPSRTQAVIVSRRLLMPATWPSPRSRPWRVAQRPLPSMMMEMWLGRRSRSTSASATSSGGLAKYGPSFSSSRFTCVSMWSWLPYV